jgi:hypothetical protein
MKIEEFPSTIAHWAAALHADAFNVVQYKPWRQLSFGKLDVGEFDAVDVFQDEARALIFVLSKDLEITDLDSLGMTDVEGVRGSGAKHRRVGVLFLFFRKLESGIFPSPTARMLDQDVADFHVFDWMPGNSCNHRTDLR